VSFQLEESYHGKTFEEIKAAHEKLVAVGITSNQLKMLSYVERGKMYNFLKEKQRFGEWVVVCNELQICRRTANRYIDFHAIINAYPRLLECELTFETIMSAYKPLRAYLLHHKQLEAKLRIPLRSTHVLVERIYSSRRMAGAGNDQLPADVPEPEELLSEGASYDAAWQLADEHFEYLETTERDDFTAC